MAGCIGRWKYIDLLVFTTKAVSLLKQQYSATLLEITALDEDHRDEIMTVCRSQSVHCSSHPRSQYHPVPPLLIQHFT